jgi:uncharacterized protein YjgD (DUF1641 family)
MAQPIALHAPAKPVPASPERLQNASAEHAEALLSAYELLQVLHDRGVLNLLRGLVGSGDTLIGTIAAAADTPESIRTMRNGLLLTRLFASVPPDFLAGLVETVSNGAKREKVQKAPGLLQLLWRLRSQESRHAMALGLDVIESLGKGGV